MDKSFEITQMNSPSENDIDFLTDQINAETLDYGKAYPFAFFIRDEDESIIAGCNGFVLYGDIYTDQLWVDKQYRQQGLGRKLMQAVEGYGKEQGCKMATVVTMSFQGALAFYQLLGYTCDHERKGYVKDSSCFFLKKSL